MSGTTLLVILIVGLLGAMQFAAGLYVGRAVSDSTVRLDTSKALQAIDLDQLAGRVAELIATVITDVAEHHQTIGQVSEHLQLLGRDKTPPTSEMVIQTVNQVVQINDRLQQRLQAAEQKLHEQSRQIELHASEARTDALTSLPNRRAFDDALARQLAEWHRKQNPFCLAILDIDHFKDLNDQYGHPRGDAVLRELGDVLRRTSRSMDLVARIGGEEFAAILPATDVEHGMNAVERLRVAIAEAKFICNETTLAITVSVGLTTSLPEDDGDALLTRADEASYVSKRVGRNCGHFHDGEQIVKIASHPTGVTTHLPDVPDEPPPEDPEDQEMAELRDQLRDRLADV